MSSVPYTVSNSRQAKGVKVYSRNIKTTCGLLRDVTLLDVVLALAALSALVIFIK